MTLLTGQTISLVGSLVSFLALPLTAVLLLNANPAQMGILQAVEYAPAAILGLFVGVWVDRMRKRPVLILADLGRGLLLGSIPLALYLGMREMSYLYAVGFLVGLLTIFFAVAYQAYLPSLVPRESLVAANGTLEASAAAARILSPGLSGALVQLVTAPFAILADAVSFFISAIFLLFIRTPEPRIERGKTGMWREIGVGLRFLVGHPLLRVTLLTSGICNFFSGNLNAQVVLYATRDLHIIPLGIGGIFAVSGVFGLLAAALAGWFGRRLGVGRLVIVALLLLGVGSVSLPLASGTPQVVLMIVGAGAALNAISDGLYNVSVVSLRQLVTPADLQGRTAAAGRVLISVAQPLGALGGGFLGVTIGLRAALLITACGYFLAFLLALLSPLRRLHSTPPITGSDGKYKNEITETSSTEKGSTMNEHPTQGTRATQATPPPDHTYIAHLWEYPQLTIALFGLQAQTPEAYARYEAAGIPEQMAASLAQAEGLLGLRSFQEGTTGSQLQYWRSHADLAHFARTMPHTAWWQWLNQHRGQGIGFYHEIYQCRTAEAIFEAGTLPVGPGIFCTTSRVTSGEGRSHERQRQFLDAARVATAE
jgi:MFS family permease